ncbi:helix-turn-helix domain-containing protein [Solwaraspora sp. WMMB335]|uniref:helix-turn-helix domain-containing protein n=1 Tax=Solwaraspora sp. WMMB335 TaxID=3404118 RepID=UPI003B9356B0
MPSTHAIDQDDIVWFVRLRYQFRVYPTPRQQVELARAFGCARVVFNDGLRARPPGRRTSTTVERG